MTTTFILDSAERRLTQISVIDDASATVTRHYTDDSDNPAWITSASGGSSTTTRFSESIGGDLSATINASSADIALANMHGDIATNVAIPNNQDNSTAATVINGWSDYGEYGAPRDASGTKQVSGPIGYGWLGGKQRSNSPETAGLTLMGARLYNPSTGRFTSADPVFRGNENAYAYPTDPINSFDLDGRSAKKKWIKGHCKDYKFSMRKTKKLIRALEKINRGGKVAKHLKWLGPQAKAVSWIVSMARAALKALIFELKSKMNMGRGGVVIRVGWRKYKHGWKSKTISPWYQYKIAPRFKARHGGWSRTKEWLNS